MPEKGYFCCFFCPSESHEEKAISEKCPKCGRPYDFTLTNRPHQVRDYRIIKAISRGFYGATYLAEWGQLKRKMVLKVVSKGVYEFFKKDFQRECQLHNAVAEGSMHLVEIRDFFEEDLSFASDTLQCHVAVLDYVEGPTLGDLIESPSAPLRAATVAQIAIDLYSLVDELEQQRLHHNDLHVHNIIIEKLKAPRGEAIDQGIKITAIDMGSLSEVSRSDSSAGRLGDIHNIARHIRQLSSRLLSDVDTLQDIDYRIASILDRQVSLLAPDAAMQRPPRPREFIDDIKYRFHLVSSPWQERLTLKKLDDAYNAQTLAPWFVPHLLVDPQGKWVNVTSSHGPQVITGMRGCGKTMLLRALQFHARAAKHQSEKADVVDRLRNDGFVGFYVSCTRLLDTLGSREPRPRKVFEKLFCAYVLEVIQGLRHLRELSSDTVSPYAFQEIIAAVEACLQHDADWSRISSESELERKLERLLLEIRENGAGTKLKTSHAFHAFDYLAKTLKRISSVWQQSYILFLLDDVSTRYIDHETIKSIISSAMVQSPECAFKLTTEAQTLELPLTSPGGLEQARQGRDFDVFDLGAQVYQMTGGKDKTAAKNFLGEILMQRAKYCSLHPTGVSPAEVLGDVPLTQVARAIVESKDTSSKRKGVYHGISSLAGVCVGDIGDVITLYELILEKGRGEHAPVEPDIQSQCYQDLCHRRLYDLNRREGSLKDFALSFAEAAHELLVESAVKVKNGSRRKDLRQYNQVYVRVTTGDMVKQFQKLRELIDAGVFVLKGGSPRTKTKDSDPILQFSLTYRKIYGISAYIGLSERDRFELSGVELEEWLNNPAKGKEILKRNQQKNPPDDSDLEKATEPPTRRTKDDGKLIYKIGDSVQAEVDDVSSAGESAQVHKSRFSIQALRHTDVKAIPFDTVVVALGFEDRTLGSVQRWVDVIKPRNVSMIAYKEEGRGREMKALMAERSLPTSQVAYEDMISGRLSPLLGSVLVDVSGLTKAAIFTCVRQALKSNGRVVICHTAAEDYYPLEKDIAAVLTAVKAGDIPTLLEKLKEILTGEKGPYRNIALLESDTNVARRRILCAFSSPKHERLLTLLDRREYDRIQVGLALSDDPRTKLAEIIAQVAASNYGAIVRKYKHDGFAEIVDFLERAFQYWYIDRGFSFECGLTGSKFEAVACAVLSSVYKLSQCWYVQPDNFEPKTFTRGVGETTYYSVSLV